MVTEIWTRLRRGGSESGRGQDAGRRGNLGEGGQTEVGVPQSRQDFRKGESQRSVARGQAWDPDLAPACPLSQRGRSSGPTTPKRKGQQEDSPLGLMLSLKGF